MAMRRPFSLIANQSPDFVPFISNFETEVKIKMFQLRSFHYLLTSVGVSSPSDHLMASSRWGGSLFHSELSFG